MCRTKQNTEHVLHLHSLADTRKTRLALTATRTRERRRRETAELRNVAELRNGVELRNGRTRNDRGGSHSESDVEHGQCFHIQGRATVSVEYHGSGA